ncbi:MAG TPA: hypothetical protein ENI95_04620, partial [Chloroflexi bacterium]|nr:hypothetical protein [Chloroflexota bacterium]
MPTMTLSREHLRDYLLHAEERAVYRVYPRHMAAELRAGYRSLLKLLVEATLEGEALLHWQLRCPICGATGDYASSLQEAHHETTCATCAATIVPHVDDEIFVTFSVHPALRRLGPHADDPDFQQSMAERFRPTTGHELLTIQTFRDWAQNQPLPTQESLEVRHVALWFSDLSGSTALYARRGDPRAFQLVRQHFDYLFEAV